MLPHEKAIIAAMQKAFMPLVPLAQGNTVSGLSASIKQSFARTRKSPMRKLMIKIHYTNFPLTNTSKALLAGMVMGTLHKHGRLKQASDFAYALKSTPTNPVNISNADFIKEANKYVYFKVWA